jgi:outer membrane beta-barrel protein
MRSLAGAAALACSLSIASPAFADRPNPLDGQPAIRYRKEMRRLRLEITPSFTTDINQDYKHAFGMGGTVVFHILDFVGVGFEGEYLFNTDTALESAVRGAISSYTTNNPSHFGAGGSYDPIKSPPNPSLAIHDQRVLGANATLSAFAQVTPFAGKFSLFSAAFAWYDLYAKGGVGLVHYTQDGCCSAASTAAGLAKTEGVKNPDPNTQSSAEFAGMKVGGMIGVGAHLYFTDWLGLQLELRDYIVKANPSGGDTNGDRKLTSGDATTQNNIFFTVGLTFMLPPKAHITR